jgi:hypothetical protein
LAKQIKIIKILAVVWLESVKLIIAKKTFRIDVKSFEIIDSDFLY